MTKTKSSLEPAKLMSELQISQGRRSHVPHHLQSHASSLYFSAKGKTILVNPDTSASVDAVPTIADAIDKAEAGDTIKITPGLYSEQITVKKPGLVFEPSLVGGDVILQQQVKPCVVIDLGPSNSVKFNNIKMCLIGPNMDVEVQGFQANMNFETEGNEKCIKEFFAMQFLKP